jgi:methylphosphotriester-DNA--protein-cysteine methyltransferase
VSALPQAAPPAVRTRRLLLRSLGVAVEDLHCRAHVEPLGPEERSASHGIVFVRKGVFRRTHEGRTLVADANHVLFFTAGQAYRYAHPIPGGDECTILALEAPRALELVAHHAPRHAERPESPFAIAYGLSSPRAAGLQYQVLRLLDRGAAGLAAEDAVAELADEAVAATYRPTRAEDVSGPALRRQRELVEAATLAVNARVGAPPSLGELAAELGCSPFHLSRTFHRVSGLSLRRYAGRLRAREAAHRLAAGARDLTGLALDLGYADHSHFTNAFRQEWGVPPSRFRAGAVPRSF